MKERKTRVGGYKRTLPFASVILVSLNLLMYIYNLMINGYSAISTGGGFGIDNNQALKIGAFNGYTPVYTWFTAMFSHISLFHLTSNLLMLIFVCIFLRKTHTENAVLIVYVISGLIANIVTRSIDYDMVWLGASGAIAGLYGLVLINLFFTDDIHQDKKYRWILRILFLILFLPFLYDSIESIHIMHITGMIIGMMFGVMDVVDIEEQREH